MIVSHAFLMDISIFQSSTNAVRVMKVVLNVRMKLSRIAVAVIQVTIYGKELLVFPLVMKAGMMRTLQQILCVHLAMNHVISVLDLHLLNALIVHMVGIMMEIQLV